MTKTNESEAMEVWAKAFDAYEGCAVQSFGANDQAAARVIATALEARDARIRELEGALRDARRIIAEIDDYMKRPERGAWGVECALCMGELLDDDRAAIARIDAILTKGKTHD